MKNAYNDERGKDIKLVQKTSANLDICILHSVRLEVLRIGDEITALLSYH